MNDIFNNQKAFAPLYDSSVMVSGTRADGSFELTVPACVLDGGISDPIGDASVDSSLSSFQIRIQPDSWASDYRPQIGDVVTLACGISLSVHTVKRDTDGDLILEARGK